MKSDFLKCRVCGGYLQRDVPSMRDFMDVQNLSLAHDDCLGNLILDIRKMGKNVEEMALSLKRLGETELLRSG